MMITTVMVIELITGDAKLRRLISRVTQCSGGVTRVSGLWGSSAPMTASLVARATRRPLLYVTAHLDEADAVLDDLELFAEHPGQLLPAWDLGPGAMNSDAGGGEIHAERLRLCILLQDRAGDASEPLLMVAPIQALMQAAPAPETLEHWRLGVSRGQQRDLSELVAWLSDRGFERLEGGGAAVDGHHDGRAFRFQAQERPLVGTVAFLQAIGNVDARRRPDRAQEPI